MQPAERLKFIRAKRGLSQSQLAALTQTSQQFINRMENRKGHFETPYSLRLCKALNVPPRWLVYGEGTYQQLDISNIAYGPILLENEITEWLAQEMETDDFMINREFIINPFHGKDNYKIFAHKISDESMMSPNAGVMSVRPTSLILFQPQTPVKSGDFVLAKTPAQENFIFRQLIKDVNNFYLRPLNPLYRTLDAGEFQIVARGQCLVEALA